MTVLVIIVFVVVITELEKPVFSYSARFKESVLGIVPPYTDVFVVLYRAFTFQRAFAT